jgi:hypothetical protein
MYTITEGINCGYEGQVSKLYMVLKVSNILNWNDLLDVMGIQPRRKRDFQGSADGTFLRDYCALPRQ